MDHPDILTAMQTGYPSIEYMDHERSYNRKNHPVVDNHPIEDVFGTGIQAGDIYMVDEKGRVVFQENIRDYLVDELGVVFYQAK